MVVMRRTLLYLGGDGDNDDYGYGGDVIRLMCNILG